MGQAHRRPLSLTIVRLAILLAFAAVLQSALLWCLLIRPDLAFAPSCRITSGVRTMHWPFPVEKDSRPPYAQSRSIYVLADIETASGFIPSGGSKILVGWRFGAPFRSVLVPPDAAEAHSALLGPAAKHSAAAKRWVELRETPPFKVIWKGFIANTIIFAAALWLTGRVCCGVLSLGRRLRGRCKHCGYDLGGLQGRDCPECGGSQ